MADSKPSFYFPFGYRGGVHDTQTGLTHFGDISLLAPNLNPVFSERSDDDLSTAAAMVLEKKQEFVGVDYDPSVGQTTAANIEWLRSSNSHAFSFSPYQLRTPTNQIAADYHMTKVTGWLGKLGFKLNNVVPDIQITSRQKVSSRARL